MLTTARRRIESILAASDEPGIVYQPIVSTADGALTGAEALARFASPPQRTPDAWFAEAETVELGAELELHSVRRALDGLSEIPSGYLSLNFSASTFTSPGMATFVGECIDVADRLVFEITEHDSIARYDVLKGVLDEFRAHGIRIAVDDAGAGYSSFAHILELKPDIIKLDISVVSGLHLDSIRRALVGAMADFAADIGATVVAEGVEVKDELLALRAAGVSHAQGYFLGRPAGLPVTPVRGIFNEPMKALIVDDDPVVRTIVSQLVRRAGVQVVGQVHNGQQAVTVATGTVLDVIILDLNMPEMDGFEALPLLRQAHPHSHIVVLSAHASSHRRNDAVALGADLCIAKDDVTTSLPALLERLEREWSADAEEAIG